MYGTFPAALAPGVRDLMRANQQCYSYFDGTAAGGMDAVNRFGDYVAAHGSFYTVLAFSLGGALVSAFLLRPDTGNERLQQAKHQIRSVAFINSIMPSAWDELESNGDGQVTVLRAAMVAAENSFIDIPTVHAWSSKDVHYPGIGSQIMLMCREECRVEVKHSAGLRVPMQNEAAVLASAVRSESYDRVVSVRAKKKREGMSVAEI
ncbi:hypothetical protein B0T24DRAFT_676441 [Lasiosphaeria ovina]|uniref:Serine hydrolase domain-containing protein n=1 Tax=Lasiosphaeria ovina TaxID=92902 RepID=A0AAE0NFV1_9PEZI|nr:hypothetical protein B0T24DRAFT_676441 [Lasiosphaeria ovina]